MNIDFFTFIGPNSADYAEYLKYTCELFISNKHKINWKCIESVKAEKLPKGYKCVTKAPRTCHNSLNHAVAMETALKYIESEYVIFIDADIAILYQDWDDIIVKELNKNDCFGVAYNHPIKYKNFPTVFLFAFRSYVLKKIHPDFKPIITIDKKSISRISLNKKNADYFNMKPGDKLKRDTGWKLPLQFKMAGFTKSKTLPMILMFSKKSQLPFADEKHKEFCRKKPEHMCEWHYNGKIFATHKQASRSHPINGKFGQAWEKRIDMYIEKKLKISKKEPSVKDKRISSYRTICEIHREIYDILIDNKKTIGPILNELILLLEDAYKIGKKMQCKLRQYKNNFDDNWYQQTTAEIIKEKLQKRKINKSVSEILSKVKKL